MADKISAGLLMYYKYEDSIKVFLVHPGGPFFAKKDEGYWGIPKGLPEVKEDLFEVAKREFFEETGIAPKGNFLPLGTVTQKGGKVVHAWAFECPQPENDNPEITCNSFKLEWPPKSGKWKEFPEVDKGQFFELDEAKRKINSAQAEFIKKLLNELKIEQLT